MYTTVNARFATFNTRPTAVITRLVRVIHEKIERNIKEKTKEN